MCIRDMLFNGKKRKNRKGREDDFMQNYCAKPRNIAFIMNKSEYRDMENHSNKRDRERIINIANKFDIIMNRKK